MNRKTLKPHALAAALLVAMAPLGSALAADGARIVNKAAIESGAEFSGFIVKFRDGTAERADATRVARSLQGANAVMAKSSRGAPGLRHFRRMGLGADVIRASRTLSAAEAVQAMQQLAAMPGVEYVEPDLIMHPALTPNDPSYSQQWGYQDADAGIRANTAWDLATGSGIRVAVLDTGQAAHPDLDANRIAGYDFITSTTVAGDGNGRDSDASDPGDYSGGQNSSWHGTHVAGTVAALTNNGVGVAGTAFNAKVMPVRVLGRGGGSTSDIADAIIWASGGTVSGVTTLTASQKAHVINMSLGGTGSCGTTTQNAINGAVSRGTTIVVAAGNSNTNVSTATPANCANVIAVASVTSASARSSFSNYGTGIDVSAPGSSILSTLNTGTTTPGSASYASYNGTSMAAPHVAGTVALIQSRRLALGLALYTPAEIESLLKSTAYPLAGACSGGCGAGIINARAAVEAAGGGGGGGGGGGSTQTYSNTADYQIRDNTTVESPITVSGRSGNAPSNASVSVNIVHTYRGDLLVQLVAPDGSLYTLSNRAGGSADNLVATYTGNLSTESLNGTWRLRVNDNAAGDIGYINSWSVTF